MQPDYYERELYPLQDKALGIIAKASSGFYLTGGTVVSRHLLHHGYSDELNLFVNRSPTFIPEARAIPASLMAAFEQVELSQDSEDFVRLFVTEDEVCLKVEMINDVGYRVGAPQATPLFIRTDTWKEAVGNAMLKDRWVNPLAVSQRLHEFPAEKLDEVIRINPPDKEAMLHDLKQVAIEAFEGSENSLARIIG